MMTDENEVLVSIKLPKKTPSIIMVLGVGGAGGNAVNHMYDLGIADVTFMVCNTDRQALKASPVPIQILLGEGLGAGNNPEKGRQAGEEMPQLRTDNGQPFAGDIIIRIFGL